MGLSLEVKKFVNSQHMGDFVNITLPGELPATRDEMRTVHNENVAAETAGRKAREAAAAKENAARALELSEKEFKKAKEAAANAAKQLAAAEKRELECAGECDKLRAAVAEYETKIAAKPQTDGVKTDVNGVKPDASGAKTDADGTKPDANGAKADANGVKSDADGAKTDAGEVRADANGAKPNASGAKADANGVKPDANGAKPQTDAEAERAALAKRVSNLRRASSKRSKELERLTAERDEAAKSTEKAPEEAKAALETLDARIKAKKAQIEADTAKLAALKAELAALDEKLKAAEIKPASGEKPAASEKPDNGVKPAGDDESEALEMLLKSKKAELENEEIKLKAAAAEVKSARVAKEAADENAAKQREKHRLAVEERDKAAKNSEPASAEAEKRKHSVRIAETKYETARIHYLEAGKGEAMILIHTAGQSLYTFRKIFSKLAMNYHVIAPDLVGHGYSDRPLVFDYTIADHAESLIRFMDALNIRTAHLLGFSMGAGFALEVARQHPERVGRLVLLCPGGVTSTMPLTVRMMESTLFGGIASRLFSVRGVEKMLSECVFDQTLTERHDIDEYYRPASDAGARYAIRRTVNRFDEDKLTSTLREIETPTLLLWGSEDRWHPIAGGEVYVQALKNCESAVVRNAGHLFHEEKPDRVCELIREFIPAGYGTDIY